MKAGWQTKRLGDFAAAVSTGPFGSILHKSDYVDDGVPLVNPINIIGDSIVPDPSKLISEVTIKRLSNYVLEEGDIVVGRRGEIGRCAVVSQNESGWICGTGSFFIRPLPSLDSQFLAHLIRSPEYREQLEKLSTGTTMKNLSNTALGDLVVSIPPLPEQRRIVAILDEAFDGIATAKANAEQNLQNARALFESHLHGVNAEKALLGDLVKITTGKLDANAAVEGGQYPFFTCSREVYAINDYAFDCEAILLAGNNAVGDFNVKHYKGKFNAYQRTYVITVNEQSRVLYRFLYFQMLKSLKKFKAKSVGVGTKFLKLGMIKEMEIELPSLAEQERIVSTMDTVREETQRLESLYQRKLAALDELKKSLLHQAFSGQL